MSQVELFRSPNSRYTIDDQIKGDDGRVYIVGERIAAGGNAVVHECNEKLSGDSYAVKFQLELRQRRRELHECTSFHRILQHQQRRAAGLDPPQPPGQLPH